MKILSDYRVEDRQTVFRSRILEDRYSRISCDVLLELSITIIVIEKMAAVMESLFYVGKKFVSYDELQSCKEIYETSNLTKLTMRDSKTLESMNKYAPKKAARANNELRYYSLRLCCSYGGKKFKRKGDGKREKE